MTSPQPFTLAFVCTANICRSAYAHVRAEQLLGPDSGIVVTSAGIHGLTGEPIEAEMGRQAHLRGADTSRFTARRVRSGFVASADLIVTASGGHRDFILEEWPAAFQKVYTFTQFMEAMARADGARSGPAPLSEVLSYRPAVHPDGDLADPYRRGEAAAAACAESIDDYLSAILPRLTQ